MLFYHILSTVSSSTSPKQVGIFGFQSYGFLKRHVWNQIMSIFHHTFHHTTKSHTAMLSKRLVNFAHKYISLEKEVSRITME